MNSQLVEHLAEHEQRVVHVEQVLRPFPVFALMQHQDLLQEVSSRVRNVDRGAVFPKGVPVGVVQPNGPWLDEEDLQVLEPLSGDSRDIEGRIRRTIPSVRSARLRREELDVERALLLSHPVLADGRSLVATQLFVETDRRDTVEARPPLSRTQ